MALEFICSNEIESGEKISIPCGANCYRLKSGKIKFFNSNPEKEFNSLPLWAEQISFDIEGNQYNMDYGNPVFYNNKSEILKTINE